MTHIERERENEDHDTLTKQKQENYTSLSYIHVCSTMSKNVYLPHFVEKKVVALLS